jgi:Carboxypeptidase regulatory-like domain
MWTVLMVALCVPGWPQSNRLPDACRLSERCFGMVHELEAPQSVRSAEGLIRIASSLPQDPLPGATMEVFGPGNSGRRQVAEADANGHFKIKGLVPGTYSFCVNKAGFNSVVGHLVISRHAARGKKILIELTFGV